MKNRTVALIIVLIFLCIAIAMGIGSLRLSFNASANTLLTDDNQYYFDYLTYQRRYSPDDFILIAIRPNQADIFSENVLESILELSNKIEQVDGVESTVSLATAPIFLKLESLQTLVDLDNLSWAKNRYSSEYLHKSTKGHPLYENLLVNSAQNTLGIQVVFRSNPDLAALKEKKLHLIQQTQGSEPNEGTLQKLEAINAKIENLESRELRDKSRQIEQIIHILEPYKNQGTFYLGGSSLLAFELQEIIFRDLKVFGLAILILVSAILFFIFGELRWVLLPLICCSISVIFTLGVLGYCGLKISVISTNIIALQVILTIAILLHLIVEYRQTSRAHPELETVNIIRAVLREKIKPCFLATLTTGIGFGTLVFSGIQPVISFGWMMIIAMLITMAMGLLLFPALILLYPSRSYKKPVKATVLETLTKRFLVFQSDLIQAPKLIFIAWTFLVIASFAMALRLETGNSFVNYFSPSTDTYKQLRFIDQQFGGSIPLDVIYHIPKSEQKPDLILSAESLNKVEKFTAELRKLDEIGSVTAFTDFTRIAQTVRAKPLTEYELDSIYNTLDTKLLTSTIDPFFSKNTNELRVSMRVEDSLQKFDRSSLLSKVQSLASKSGISPKDITLTNVFVLYEDILSRLISSQLTTLGLVYLAMLTLLLAVLKDWRLATISMVPNIVTTTCLFGLMGIFKIPLDLMTVTIAAIAMGVSVDDTIHYIFKYRNLHNGDRIRSAHLSVGIAITYTTFVIALGFGALLFSDFMPSVYFGVLSALAMGLALLSDLTLLPALLQHFGPALASNPTTR